MIRLHTTMASVNGYKVRILLSILGLEWEHVDVDMYAMEHKKEPYLSLNLFGQMPAMTDGDYTIADSHACLAYLARKYDGGGEPFADAGIGAIQNHPHRLCQPADGAAGAVR